MHVLRVVGSSLRDLWEELFLVLGLSLLWWLAVITVVGVAPATTAVAAIGYRLARGERVGLDFAKEAFREHFWLSWRVGLVSLVVAGLIAFNVVFYAQAAGWPRLLVIFFLYLGVAWAAVNLYAFPLIPAMEIPSMRLVLRNAAVIAFANPVFSLLLILIIGVLTVIALILPVLAVVVLPGLVGILSGHALVDRLQVAEARHNRRV